MAIVWIERDRDDRIAYVPVLTNLLASTHGYLCEFVLFFSAYIVSDVK
jgi:hypothetical protein